MKGELPTIIVDTREKKPLLFANSEVHGLKTGDYSVLGYEDLFCVEHKTVKDLIGTCDFKNRERFRRELQRMKDSFDFYCIVISGSESDIDDVCKKLYATQWKQWLAKTKRGIKARKPMRPEVRIPSVKGSLKAFRADFNCHYYFLRNKEDAAGWIQEQAMYYLRNKGGEA